MKLTQSGVAPAKITLLWSLLHIVKMISSHYGGRLSDRLGRAPTLTAGWILYSVVSLPASLLFGVIWQTLGSQTAFIFGSSCSLVGTLMIWFLRPTPDELKVA